MTHPSANLTAWMAVIVRLMCQYTRIMASPMMCLSIAMNQVTARAYEFIATWVSVKWNGMTLNLNGHALDGMACVYTRQMKRMHTCISIS